MELRAGIKGDARTALRWCWGRTAALLLLAVALSLFVSLIEGLCLTIFDKTGGSAELYAMSGINMLREALARSPRAMLITGVSSLAALALEIPFSIGCRGWYFRMAGGARESIITALTPFSSLAFFLRSVGLTLLLLVKKLGWALLLLAPGGALLFLPSNAASGLPPLIEPGRDTEALRLYSGLSGAALLLLGALLYLIVIQRYFASPYYLANGSTIVGAVKASAEATRGRRLEILIFQLSFTGWWALCFFIVPALFSQPYHAASSAIFARYLMERAEREKQPASA